MTATTRRESLHTLALVAQEGQAAFWNKECCCKIEGLEKANCQRKLRLSRPDPSNRKANVESVLLCSLEQSLSVIPNVQYVA